MPQGKSVSIEALESRRLLSAATLAADQQNLTDAIARLASDQKASVAALAQDRATISSLKGAPDPALETLLTELQTDIAARVQALAADRVATGTLVAQDQSVITQDQLQIRLDRKNPAQLLIDKTTLATDRAKLTTDRVNGKLALISDALQAATLIAEDRSAISAEHRSGASNPDFKAAQDQLVSDTILWKAQIVSDQTAIVGDRAIVALDKKEPAGQSTDLTGHYSGTVIVSQGININLGDYPATLDVTSQTATTIVATLLVPGLNIDAEGTFSGAINASGQFNFSITTNGATVTLTGQESASGSKLTGNGITFQFAGYDQLASFELDRTS